MDNAVRAFYRDSNPQVLTLIQLTTYDIKCIEIRDWHTIIQLRNRVIELLFLRAGFREERAVHLLWAAISRDSPCACPPSFSQAAAVTMAV